MKKPLNVVPVLLASLLFIMSGCVPLPPATPTATTVEAGNQAAATSEPAPADPLSRCLAATDTLQRLVVPEGRYCLAYPSEYKVEKPNAEETILLLDGLLNAADPRVHIRVTDAGGTTAAAAADRVVADFTDFPLERSERTVAGEPAVMLDRVPGQEINRRVLFVRDGLLYDLMFAPADPTVGETFARMNALQEQVLGSFTFLPAGFAIDDDCLTPTGGRQLHRDPTRGFCLLYPAGYNVQQTDGSETLFYSGSLLDVSKPRLFVRVEDANGQTAKEIADAFVAELETGVPGHQIDRPFGVTLGYQPAELLDKVPGQDLGRVLIAVHGPRAYRLTFVPVDPAGGAMFQETEALYDLVLRSFRFLN